MAQRYFTISFAIHSSSSAGKPHPDLAPSIQQGQVDEGVRGLPVSCDPRAVPTDVFVFLEEAQGPIMLIFEAIPADARSGHGRHDAARYKRFAYGPAYLFLWRPLLERFWRRPCPEQREALQFARDRSR